MKRSELCFLICVESGVLEGESVLLCKSIRRFGGKFANAPIYSFSPRREHRPSRRTLQLLEKEKVVHSNITLNKKYPDYPYANKPLVAAYAQEHLDFDSYVILDSDMLCFGEPKLLQLGGSYGAAVHPVHATNTAAKKHGRGQNEKFWREMYKTFGIEQEPFVESTMKRVKIRAHWNAGLICVKRSSEVFANWHEIMEKMFEMRIRPRTGEHFFDEISMSLALLKCLPFSRIRQLPLIYNFPLEASHYLKAQKRWRNLDKMVFCHYMATFEKFPQTPLSFMNWSQSPQAKWLQQNLNLIGLG